MEDKILYIVIPCYNEEAVLEETARQLLVKMETLMKNEDGSGMGGGCIAPRGPGPAGIAQQ